MSRESTKIEIDSLSGELSSFYRPSASEEALSLRPEISTADLERAQTVYRLLGIRQQITIQFENGLMVIGRSRIEDRFFVAVSKLGTESFFFFEGTGRLKWSKNQTGTKESTTVEEIDAILTNELNKRK